MILGHHTTIGPSPFMQHYSMFWAFLGGGGFLCSTFNCSRMKKQTTSSQHFGVAKANLSAVIRGIEMRAFLLFAAALALLLSSADPSDAQRRSRRRRINRVMSRKKARYFPLSMFQWHFSSLALLKPRATAAAASPPPPTSPASGTRGRRRRSRGWFSCDRVLFALKR